MEKWNELCYILSENLPSNTSEQLFELKVIQAFEKLGWSEFRNEIIVRESIQIGSQRDRINPDLVIQSDEKGNLFVIEVKRPGIAFNSDFKGQLKSYMRQLKLEFGILIGHKIQIFYDGNLFGYNKFALLDEIEFKRDNPKGLRFVELFIKENYKKEKIEQYAQEKAEIEKEKKKFKILKKEVISSEYKESLIQKIKLNLLDKHNEKTIEKVFSEIELSIRDKSISYSIPKQTTFKNNVKPKNSLNFEKREQDYLAIGKYVRKTLNELIENDLIGNAELERLQRSDYSKQTFDVQFPFFKRDFSINSNERIRYYKNPYLINGQTFYLTSQWYEVSANNDRPYYERWLQKMKNK